jgi:hypothetical protein
MEDRSLEPAMEALTERDASTVSGKKSWTGFYPKRRATALDEAIATGQSFTERTQIGGKEGLLRASPRLDDAGEVMGASVVFVEDSAPKASATNEDDAATLLRVLDQMLRHDLSESAPPFDGLLGNIAERINALQNHLRRTNSFIEDLANGVLSDSRRVACDRQRPGTTTSALAGHRSAQPH